MESIRQEREDFPRCKPGNNAVMSDLMNPMSIVLFSWLMMSK